MKSPRKLVATLAFLVLALLPALAFAQETAGSDTSKFERTLSEGGPLVAFGASFVAGIVASLTPCVYPMIIITVSIFGAKEAKSRWQGAALSAVFVLGIVTLFAPLGVLSALSGKAFGSFLGNPYVVAVIALVFTALAASMFGAFELALPSSLNAKLTQVGGVGYKGAFILGLVCGLVAAPCVGPFMVGLLTWITTTKNVVIGGGAMTFFALGLGLLFFIVGTFAIALPKAGAWMMAVKWGAGVVMAYMALAFIRDAWPALKKGVAHASPVYGVIAMAVLAIGLGLGAVHIAAERRKSKIAHLSKRMKLMSIVPAVAGAFMFMTWMQMPKTTVIPDAYAQANGQPGAASVAGPIAWVKSEPEGIAKAQAEKKPVMIDFGAEWCGACKELEHETFPDPRVRNEAARFVAISVDGTDEDAEPVQAAKKKYKVVGFPAVIILDSKGQEATRFTEKVSPERLAEALKKVN